MATRDEDLRAQKLIFYKEDMDKINTVLDDFVKSSNSKCAFLVDKDGHLVTKAGDHASFDSDTISALVAGSFAATKQMASLMGEEEFSVMFHQGKKDNIQLSLIGERTILAVVFDDKTTIGMVRLYASQVGKRLDAIFVEASGRKADPDAGIDEKFGEKAEGTLDDIFGD